MARIFITGSADGLGQMAARILVGQGHQLVLHARNEKRGWEAMAAVPGAEAVLSADLSVKTEMKKLVGDVNALGAFDAIIHNAAMSYQEQGRGDTPDGLPPVFAMINSVISLAIAFFFPIVGFIVLVVRLPALMFSKGLFKAMKLKDQE